METTEEYIQGSESTSSLNTWRDALTALWIGAVVGWVVWLGAVALNQYAVGPVACQTETSVIKCDQSMMVSSAIATVFGGIAGLILLVRHRVVRPLLVVLAVVATQWGIGSTWLDGYVWYFSVLLTMLITALFYAVFVWFTQGRRFWIALLATIVLIVAFRVLITL